jgi:phage gp46-like protein
MDLALLFTEHGDFDIQVRDGDLAGDPTPVTPLTISLFTDRLAFEDDPLPQDGGDRRGWWGDSVGASPMGSRLWLLSREKEVPEVVARARRYAAEALSWIVAEGGDAAAEARDGGRGRLYIEGAARLVGDAAAERWLAEIDAEGPVRINILGGS